MTKKKIVIYLLLIISFVIVIFVARTVIIKGYSFHNLVNNKMYSYCSGISDSFSHQAIRQPCEAVAFCEYKSDSSLCGGGKVCLFTEWEECSLKPGYKFRFKDLVKLF